MVSVGRFYGLYLLLGEGSWAGARRGWGWFNFRKDQLVGGNQLPPVAVVTGKL